MSKGMKGTKVGRTCICVRYPRYLLIWYPSCYPSLLNRVQSYGDRMSPCEQTMRNIVEQTDPEGMYGSPVVPRGHRDARPLWAAA